MARTKEVGKEMKWNEYGKGEVYFLNPEKTVMYLVEEGSGDNLLDEDYEEGYVDYWLTSTFDLEKKEITEEQAMWMEEETIFDRDYTIGEIIERMKECDAPDGLETWEILPVEKGMEIREKLEEIDLHMWKAGVEKAKAQIARDAFHI